MPYFNYDYIRIYYEDDGGDGEPFIFLHGLGGDVNQGRISTGAGVSLHLALRYPSSVKKLVFSRPAWKDKPQVALIREAYAKFHEVLQDTDPLTAQNRYENSEVYKSINSLSTYAGESLLGQFKYPYVKETSMKFVKLPMDCPNHDREAWKKLKLPTLILASQLDPIHPYTCGRLLSEYIRNAKFIEIISKTISNKQHNHDSYVAIKDFLNER